MSKRKKRDESAPPLPFFCRFCGGDANEPDHEARCDGRQGGKAGPKATRPRKPRAKKKKTNGAPPRPRTRHEFRSYAPWPHSWARENPAFDGLSEEMKDVITDDTISEAMIKALGRVLEDGAPHHVYEVIRRLAREPWWRPDLTRSSKERFLRKIFDTGVARLYPLASGNYGYAIGDAEMFRASAERERRLERGARDKAAAFERLAEAVDSERGA